MQSTWDGISVRPNKSCVRKTSRPKFARLNPMLALESIKENLMILKENNYLMDDKRHKYKYITKQINGDINK